MNKIYKIGIALFLVSLIAMSIGCEEKDRQGYDERVDIRAEYGEPEDIYTYSSDDYWSESWWYWSQGIEFDFGKRERIRKENFGCTDIIYTDIVVASTYEFPPITSRQEQTDIREEFEKQKFGEK